MGDSSDTKLRIIIIDDELEWRDSNRRRMERLGHRAEVASDLIEAESLIDGAKEEGDPYNVAIVDRNFMIAGRNSQDGEDIIQYLKSKHPNITRIMLTGDSLDSEDINELMFVIGVDYYIEKNRISDKKFNIALQRARQQHASSASVSQFNPTIHNTATSHLTLTDTSVIELSVRFVPGQVPTLIWESHIGGSTQSQLKLSLTEADIALLLRALDAVHWSNEPQFNEDERAKLIRFKLWEAGRIASNIDRRIGQLLYQAIIDDPPARTAIDMARNTAASRGIPLSLILRFPPSAITLAAIPWELLCDERQPILLSRAKGASCVRYIDLAEAVPPFLATREKLHMLAVCPKRGIPDELHYKEKATRTEALQQLIEKELLVMEELHPVDRSDLADRLQYGERVDILHFYGHGVWKNGGAYLQFDDGLLDAGQLATLLSDIPLVVLHACRSGAIETGDMFTGIAPMLSAEGVSAVVAMQFTVSVEVANRFSAGLYRNLANGEALQTAVTKARRDLYVTHRDSWYVPVVYIRSHDFGPVYLVKTKAIGKQ